MTHAESFKEQLDESIGDMADSASAEIRVEAGITFISFPDGSTLDFTESLAYGPTPPKASDTT